MRTALGNVLWTLEDLAHATDAATGSTPTRQALLDQLDRALTDLGDASSALATLAWPAARSGTSTH
jgi:hypothetical protein